MYKLLAKQPNTDVWVQLETLTTDLPINKQRNDIAELKDRQGDYSQAISLPMIQKNCEFFGYINGFTTVSDLRRKKYDCRLFYNGVEIVSKGSWLKIVRISEYFEVQILGTESLFIQKLNENDKTINDLNITDELSRSCNTVYLSNPANGVFFGLSDFQNETGSTLTFDRSIDTLYSKALYPFVKFKLILDQLLIDNGNYTLETNIGTEKELLNSCIPLEKMNPTDYQIKDNSVYFNTTTFNYYMSFTRNESDFTVIQDKRNFDFPIVLDPVELDRYVYSYRASFAGKYTIYFDFDIITYENLLAQEFFNVYLDDIIVFNKVSFFNGTSHRLQFQESITLDMQADSILKFRLTNGLEFGRNYTNNIMYVKVTDFVTDADNTDNSYNYIIPVKGNLPDIKQSDFFKSFLQAFGLTMSIDDSTKTIYAYNFDKVIENKSLNKDWTYKLNQGKNTINHQLGEYGKENTLKYATESSNDTEFTDKASFIIDDETIKSTNIVVELLYESTENIDYKGYNVAKIKWLNGYKKDGNINPKLCIVSDTTVQIGHLKDDDNDFITPELYVISTKNTTDGIDITANGLITKYYNSLINYCLNDIRFIEDAEFFLDAIDIQEYDPFVPIYLQQYSSYFYINKIKNFIAGKLTKVDLIKI